MNKNTWFSDDLRFYYKFVETIMVFMSAKKAYVIAFLKEKGNTFNMWLKKMAVTCIRVTAGFYVFVKRDILNYYSSNLCK